MVVPPTPIMTDKSELRRLMRATRSIFVAGLSEEARGALGRGLATQLGPLLEAGRTVASYLAIGPEIDPALQGLSIRLAYPRVAGERLTFHFGEPGSFIAGYAGILEPPAGSPAATPDVVLVPLVAADLGGNRIGQGGGHYDRALAALRAGGPVTAIGIAWEVQLLPAIPADPWDQPLDWIATPQRLVDCRAHR